MERGKIGLNAILTQKEIDFLNQPHLAAFASINKDGTANVTPVSFILEDGKLLFSTNVNSVKATNIQRDGRVTIVAFEDNLLGTYVRIKGKARISNDRKFEDYMGKIALKYIDPETLRKMAATARTMTSEVIIEVEPESASWRSSSLKS
jgi:PPOX class probable F420-dependent enzyme